MNAITEQILHEVQELSDDKQQEALEYIQLLSGKSHKKKQQTPNGKEIAKILERIASRSNAICQIDDPVAWQRKIRKDRPLPHRNE